MGRALPPDLAADVEREDHSRGLSLSDFVSTILAGAISHTATDDPLFADAAVYRDDGPRDLAAIHDEYLYASVLS